MSHKTKSAIGIARDGLRWCYSDRGIMSGSRLVCWSWDSFFASFGALELGDTAMVKQNLELYLKFQRADGAIPKRMAHRFYWLRFIGIKVPERSDTQRPTFATAYFTGTSLTQNPTFILSLYAYIEKTGDLEFLKQKWPQVLRIMDYLRRHQKKHSLLKEALGGGWAESVLKRGAISFTNICYARSLWCMADLARQLDEKYSQRSFHSQYLTVKAAINTILWSDEDGGYYSDWVGTSRHHHFAADGNLLAIYWDIADQAQTKAILSKLGEMLEPDEIPIRLAYANYYFWRIYIFNWIGGMKNYHVGFSWTWLGSLYAMVLQKVKQSNQAEEIIDRIATVIERDQTVYEIYYRDKPVKTFFYASEHPWAWGAGLFLKACADLGYNIQKIADNENRP